MVLVLWSTRRICKEYMEHLRVAVQNSRKLILVKILYVMEGS